MNIVTNKCQVLSINCDTPSKVYFKMSKAIVVDVHIFKKINVRVAPLWIITYQQRLLAALRGILFLHFIFVKVLRKFREISANQEVDIVDFHNLLIKHLPVSTPNVSLAQCPCSKYKEKFQRLSSFFLLLCFLFDYYSITLRNKSLTVTFLGDMCDDIWMNFKCDYRMGKQF